MCTNAVKGAEAMCHPPTDRRVLAEGLADLMVVLNRSYLFEKKKNVKRERSMLKKTRKLVEEIWQMCPCIV